MASFPFGDSDDDSLSKRRNRAKAYEVVYTRRSGKKASSCNRTAPCTTSATEKPTVLIASGQETEVSADHGTDANSGVAASPNRENLNVSAAVLSSRIISGDGADVGLAWLNAPVTEGDRDGDTAQRILEPVQQELHIPTVQGNNGSTPNEAVKENAGRTLEVQNLAETPDGARLPLALTSFGDYIRFNLGWRSARSEIEELKQKLESDLESVRGKLQELEYVNHNLASSVALINNNKLSVDTSFIGSEAPAISEYDHSQPDAQGDLVERNPVVRANPEMGYAVHQEGRPLVLARVNSDVGFRRNLEPRPFSRQLSVAVTDTQNRFGEFVEKEKRTPKANQLYKNSEFLLGKDRLPPEGNKRSKTGGVRKHGGDAEHGFGFDKARNQAFRNCSNLLQRLMNHKFGWVFNEPVDAEKMGLVDYHDIIKNPLDLGTIKDRLSQNRYKFPLEFAEDVRLVFRNAMLYNPKGQDVHIMAEQLSEFFEQKWAVIEMEYNDHWKYLLNKGGRFPATASRKVPAQSYSMPTIFPADSAVRISGVLPSAVQPSTMPVPQTWTFATRAPLSVPVGAPPMQRSHVGRVPVPKKPKAKDPNKRNMTHDEKLRLSKHLQDLPSEKLDAIVNIIRKRNAGVSQNDEEIEVDIDNVDPETLWELDRFVANYKKNLNKKKRKMQLARQAVPDANPSAALVNSTPATAVTAVSTETGALEKNDEPPERDKGGARSESSSSSSSSDSGSSSDSDSDSSSSDGSDPGPSPAT